MNDSRARDGVAPVASTEAKASDPARASLMIGALGVVFGDIGTSPIYAFRESIKASGSSGIQASFLACCRWCFGRSSSS
jgi:KUP system potassium uptake protein